MFNKRFLVFACLLLINHSVVKAAQLDISLAKVELHPTVAGNDGNEETAATTLAPIVAPTPPPTTTTASTTSASRSTTTTPITTTTPAGTTTSAAPPSSTTLAPAPTPYPAPSIGQWNSSCIMVKMAAQLNITYETKDKNTSTALYNIPTNGTYYDGQCKTVTQTIQVNWGTPEAQSSMLLEFDIKNQTAQLTMLRFVIPIVGERFPNALENQTIFLLHMGNDFGSPLKMSYHCTRPQQFNLTETLIDTQIVGTVTVHDVQVEAFRSQSSSIVFSPAHDCDSAVNPGIVPIAVGIALVGMIMIILISYLCARRRSTSRAYMSF